MLADENDGLGDLGRKGRKGRRPVYVAPVVYEPAPVAVPLMPGCISLGGNPSLALVSYVTSRGYAIQKIPSPSGTQYWACLPGLAPIPQAVAVPAMPAPAPIPMPALPEVAPATEVMGLDEGGLF